MEHKREFSEITPKILELSELCFENSNIEAVMDGDIDGFITAYLTAQATGELETR